MTSLRRDMSYLLGFRAPKPPKRREQLALFEPAARRQMVLGEAEPYPPPPAPAVPHVPMYTGAGAEAEDDRAWAALQDAKSAAKSAQDAGAPAAVVARLEERVDRAMDRADATRRSVSAKRPPETYSNATARLLDALTRLGWTSTSSHKHTGRPLKVPHALSPSGNAQLWFKPEAVYFTEGRGNHQLGAARSLHVDRRGMMAGELLAQLDLMRVER
jgi:hypothetical protein